MMFNSVCFMVCVFLVYLRFGNSVLSGIVITSRRTYKVFDDKG